MWGCLASGCILMPTTPTISKCVLLGIHIQISKINAMFSMTGICFQIFLWRWFRVFMIPQFQIIQILFITSLANRRQKMYGHIKHQSAPYWLLKYLNTCSSQSWSMNTWQIPSECPSTGIPLESCCICLTSCEEPRGIIKSMRSPSCNKSAMSSRVRINVTASRKL